MQVTHCFNPLSTDHDIITLPDPGEDLSPNKIIAVNALVFSRPVICVVNGDIWGRKDWDCPVPVGGVVRFIEFPRGGDSNPLKIIGAIAIAVLSYYTAGLAGAAYGPAWGAAAGAAVGVVGSILLSTLFPVDFGTSDLQNADTVYSVSGSNKLRVGEPYAERFGRRPFYPDLAQMSYARYEENEQYLYVLMILGIGEFEDINIYIDKTPLGDYSDTESNVIAPGELPTIVTDVCYPSMEVGGQELDTDWVTYVVNPSGTGVYIIEYDIAFTGGLIRYTDEGKRQSRSVTVETEVRTIDEHGEGVSEWTTFHSRKYKATSKDPLFYTNKIGAPLGNDRYEFRIRRTEKESSSAQIVERCSVAGLRGFAGLHPAVDGVTMLECKIKATKQLNGEVSSKIGVRATRMLYPVTATGFGAVKEGTRSVADAVAYIVTADNGGKQDDSILVWEEMYALKTLFESEGFFFDWGFTSRSSVMDAAAKAARCAMAVPYTPGGLFCLVADRVQASTTLTFTGATAIDKGSLSITHSFHTPDSPDHVLVTYTDPVTWQPTTVTCVTVGGGNETPYEITLDGCTDREQAYKVGMRAWKELLLTTTGVTWTTGLMGHLPTLFSWVNVGEETVDFGQTGVIVSSEAGYIWFSEPVDFQGQAEGWLMVQLPDGTGGGPYTVHPTNYAHCVAGAIPGLRTLKDDAHKATPYVFGPVSEDIHVVRITSIAPGGRDKIELGGEVVNVEVYDLSDAPPTPGSPIVAGDPLISVDVAYEGLDDDGFTRHLLLTWSGSADTFLVEVDDGSGYATVEDNYSGFSLSHDIITTSATVRVTPYQSDGTTLDTDHQLTASYTRVPPPTGLTYTIDESEDKVTLTWNEVANAKYYQVGLYVGDEERISVIAESTEYSTYIYAMNNMGAYYGCTVRVTAFVGAIESDPTSVNINLHGALAAPVVEIDTTAAGVVYLHWEGINAGTYYRPVIGWTYRVVNYHVYVGSYAGFDPLTEGTLLYSTTSIEVTHRPDVTIPFAHYYKVAASISTYPNPTYLNFSNTVVFAVSDGTAPAAPSAPVLQLTLASAVMINWSGVSGASGYKVYVGATVDFNPETEGAEVYSGSNAYATISLDLTSPYAYYVKVASFDAYFSDVGDINFSGSLEISG